MIVIKGAQVLDMKFDEPHGETLGADALTTVELTLTAKLTTRQARFFKFGRLRKSQRRQRRVQQRLQRRVLGKILRRGGMSLDGLRKYMVMHVARALAKRVFDAKFVEVCAQHGIDPASVTPEMQGWLVATQASIDAAFDTGKLFGRRKGRSDG